MTLTPPEGERRRARREARANELPPKPSVSRSGGATGEPRGPRRRLLVLLALVLLLAAAGTAGWLVTRGGTESSAPTPTSGALTPEDAAASPPPFVPGGTAAENLKYFNWVNLRTIGANSQAGGMDFVNALSAAGFDRAAMQRTADRTAIDLAADSVEFSVQMGQECLIGQYGAGSNGYHYVLAPVVPGIGCLIGQTEPIE